MDERRKVLTSAGTLITAIAAVVGIIKGHGWLTVVLPIVAVVVLVSMIVVWLSTVLGLVAGWRKTRKVGDRGKPKAPFTALWRNSTDGMDAVGAMNSFNKAIHHPGQANRETTPSKAILVILVPCGPLDDSVQTTVLIESLITLLNGQQVRELVDPLSQQPKDVSWHSYQKNGALNNGLILGHSAEGKAPPLATAILNLPDVSRYQHFSDQQRAELHLMIEHRRAEPLTLGAWQAWIVDALGLAPVLAQFLKQVGLKTYDDVQTQVGIWLESPDALFDLVDPGAVQRSASNTAHRTFPMYLLADPTGKKPALVALDALRACCDYGLRVHGYESQLEDLRLGS